MDTENDDLEKENKETTEVSEEDVSSKQVSVRLIEKIKSLIAILLLGAIAVGGTWFFKTNQYKGKKVAQRHYIFPEKYTKRYLSEDLLPLEEGIHFLDHYRYEKAIYKLQPFQTDTQLRPKAQLLMAHAFLQQAISNSNENPELINKALGFFEQLKVNSDPVVREEAQWFWILCKIVKEEKEKTVEVLFEKIATDEKHTYHEDAVLLKDRIDSIWY